MHRNDYTIKFDFSIMNTRQNGKLSRILGRDILLYRFYQFRFISLKYFIIIRIESCLTDGIVTGINKELNIGFVSFDVKSKRQNLLLGRTVAEEQNNR